MTTGMPELGSKISLISKADIRYEGRLYTVDPQECTIALSNVRSFGTEDRDTQYQIAPQSQIYDYILFRGSDIKDIRVVNNSLPHPNDPAIMQVQLPNGQHLMPHFSMQNMNPPHTGGIGASGFGNPFGAMAGLGNIGNGTSTSGVAASLAPGSSGSSSVPSFIVGNNHQQQLQQQNLQQKQQKQPNMLAGTSRSTTPISLVSRKSPSAEMGIQQLQQQQQHNQNQANAGHGGNIRDAGHKRQNHQQQRGNRGNDFYHQHQASRGGDGRLDNYNQFHDARNNYSTQRNQANQNRNWTMHRGGPINNMTSNIRNRGPTLRGRMPNQGYRQMGLLGSQNKPRSKNTIKFEQDFDFEQANSKFEELRSKLSKLKVVEDNKTEQLNSETDKKDDSGNETGAGDHEHEEEEISVGYDKTKSFFDNISCEAAQDRSKNKKNDWRQERKLNSETFGVSSTRRGSYRGRPTYYNNRNVNNYMGGGFNSRGYRGNFRNRSNNRSNNLINNRDNQTSHVMNGNGSSTNLKAQAQTTVVVNSATPASTASKGNTGQENLVSPLLAPIGSGQ